MIYPIFNYLIVWVRVNPSLDAVTEPTPTRCGGADPDTPSRCCPQNAGPPLSLMCRGSASELVVVCVRARRPPGCSARIGRCRSACGTTCARSSLRPPPWLPACFSITKRPHPVPEEAFLCLRHPPVCLRVLGRQPSPLPLGGRGNGRLASPSVARRRGPRSLVRGRRARTGPVKCSPPKTLDSSPC